MDIKSILGSVAGILTTIAFIPQVIKVIKTKSTKDISLWMYILFVLGVLCWAIYGIMLKEAPIIAANITTFLLALITIGYKIKYK